MIQLTWRPTTKNRKTGEVPTATVTGTREDVMSTCRGCSLIPTSRGGSGDKVRCYSHGGLVGMTDKRSRAAGPLPRRSLASVLGSAVRSARMVRATSIGDLARCDAASTLEDYQTARRAGLSWVAYSHFVDDLEAAHGDLATSLACASVESVGPAAPGWADRVVHAIDTGYRVALAAPTDATADSVRAALPGVRVLLCPAIAAPGRVTCNQCRLCDPTARGPQVVLFPDHGPARKRQR